jgi:uncharacterized protein
LYGKVLDIIRTPAQIEAMRILAVALLLLGCSHQKESPLVGAVRAGNVEAVRTLIKGGADPNATSGGNDWPPLLHAVHVNQLQTAAALIDGGAAIDAASSSGMTPLMMAAGYDNPEMVTLLVSRGANPAVVDGDRKTALDYAITGVTDIDRFTYFRCNQSTAAQLMGVSPAPRTGSLKWAKSKGCK